MKVLLNGKTVVRLVRVEQCFAESLAVLLPVLQNKHLIIMKLLEVGSRG